MTQSTNLARYKFIIALLVCFFVIGIVPVFSQQILATFGFGRQGMDYEIPDFVEFPSRSLMVSDGWTGGANVLFTGSSGLTVSLGADALFSIGDGGSFDPVFGIGYVYYNTLYLGGILNCIPKPFIEYEDSTLFDGNGVGDVFVAPTLVGGFDFGTFLLEARVAYLRGFASATNGFKFSIGAGVNLGSGGAYR